MEDKLKIPAPEGQMVYGATPRLEPDVSSADVVGAGATQEAIETDYWFLTNRQEDGYRQAAFKKTQELGYPIPTAQSVERPRSYDYSNGYGGFDLPENQLTLLEDGITQAMLAARRKYPAEFEGMPITPEEIETQVNSELRAEWDDAEKTLNRAPEGFWGRAVPEFIGRMGTAATDEVNVPITIATAGLGSSASLGRIMLIEGAASLLGEAGTIPKQFKMAERLDLQDPNVAQQLAFAAIVGAGLPVAFRGMGKAIGVGARVTGVTNRALVEKYRASASELNPETRAAVNVVERRLADETVGPAAPGADQAETIDAVMRDLDEGVLPAVDQPPADPARVDDLMTPPRIEAEPAPLVVPKPATVSLEARLGGLVRDSEGAGYDTPSDYTVIQSPKPLPEMTLDEIDAWQAANQDAGAESTAAGGYQIIRKTLRGVREQLGLNGSELFTPALQDRMAAALMEGRGLSRFRSGEISADEFADNLAGEWASFPLASGRSNYAGDGLNAAQVDRGTVMGILDGDPYQSSGRPPPRLVRIPSAGVRVDPRAYQFRTDVDGDGVGTALNRVNEWDELLAGDMIIHERFDGGRYIADGHHRRQLAARLEADGHPPIDFNAFVLREADGYSVEAVRAIAAVKNIEAGNATAVDAAKVLRVDPAMLEKLSLRNTQARDARGLMKLNDDAFDMVTNRQVREDQAAYVGELTSDPEMQSAIMRTLIQAQPRSMAEARQIAHDAYRAGLTQREAGAQGSLFGDDFDLSDTLFKERAAVLSRALAQLRNDKRVFATLIKERDRIQEVGNEIAEDANAARLNTDETALTLIEKLVNRAGPLDDALNAAARTARRGTITNGTSEFLGAVRSAIEGGDVGRLLDGSAGRPADAPKPHGGADEGAGGGSANAADAGLDGKATPGPDADPAPRATERTAAGDQTLIDGVTPITDKQRLEAAQNAPLRGGDAATDGGLFDTGARDQVDMFAPDQGGASVGLGNAFDDPSPTSPAVKLQMEAAENDLRQAVDADGDFAVPTGRMIDGDPETISAADLLADLDADDDFISALDVCKI
jgi:hypothetical protein